MSTIDVTANNAKATGGKGNGTLLSWDSDKVVKINIQDALFDPAAFSAHTGIALATGATTLYMREVLTVVEGSPTTNDKVTLTKTPLANSVTIFKMVGDNMGTEISPITVTGSDVTWLDAAGPGTGGTVMAFYRYTSDTTAQLMQITTDTFPGYYRVVGDTVVRNESTGVDEPMQIVVEKAKLMPNVNIKLEPTGDPTVITFDMEAYKPANSKQLIRFIKY